MINNIINKLFLFVFTFFIANISGAAQESVSPDSIKFPIDKIRKHLRYLSDDLFEGRAVGAIGGNLAEKYLADRLNDIGLIPFGGAGSFYQHIPMHGSKPLQESKLTIYADSLDYELEFGKDFLLYKTGEQTYNPGLLDLVFVGYGINAPEYDYDDFQNIDLEGKIAVFLSGEPISDDPKFFDGAKNTIHSYPETKHRAALAHGAAGSILVPDPKDFMSGAWNRYINSFAFEDVTLAYTVSGGLSLLLNPVSAETLFEGSEYPLSKIFKLEAEHKLKSFPLKSKLKFDGKFKQRDFVSSNVIGLLRGKDPALSDEYIIVSAHYDHLGIGPAAIDGDTIYNGVLDNAIGCAGLIELASMLGKSNIQLNRSIIFLLCTGEEKGLLGSAFYTDNPSAPLYKTTANINIDGLAFIDKFKSIVPIGADQSDLKNIVCEVANKINLQCKGIPPIFMDDESSFMMSDQASFANAGIPSVLIMDGIDYEKVDQTQGLKILENYSKYIYHSPKDDLTQTINYEATNRHLNYLYRLIVGLANTKQEINWTAPCPYYNARLRSKAEKK
jgi:hypothetical protein